MLASMTTMFSHHPRHNSTRGQELFSSPQQSEEDEKFRFPNAFEEQDDNDDELVFSIDQAILDTSKQFAARKAGSDGDDDKRHRWSRRDRKESAHKSNGNSESDNHSMGGPSSEYAVPQQSRKNRRSDSSENPPSSSRGSKPSESSSGNSRRSGSGRNMEKQSTTSPSSRSKPTRSRPSESSESEVSSSSRRHHSSDRTNNNNNSHRESASRHSKSTSSDRQSSFRDERPRDRRNERREHGCSSRELSSKEPDEEEYAHPNPSAAARRREAARYRGTEALSPAQQAEADALYGSTPAASAAARSSSQKTVSERHSSRDVSITPSRRRQTMDHSVSSRTRPSQRAEKRQQWKQAKSGGKRNNGNNNNNNNNGEASSFDDILDEKVQRRQSMLETSKRGIVRATASRTRGRKGDDAFEYDNDYDDCSSVASSYSHLTAESDLADVAWASEMQRRQSCSYLPSGLSGSAPNGPGGGGGRAGKVGRRPSAFGSSLERQKAISIVASGVGGGNNGDDDDSDEESVASNYIPAGLSKNCNFDVDRSDHNATRKSAARRVSISASQLTVPIVDAPSAADANNAGSTRDLMSLRSSGNSGSFRHLRRASTLGTMPAEGSVPVPRSKPTRRASTIGSGGEGAAASSSSKHDKRIEEILKNRRLRGDNSLSRNRYAQEEKEEEQKRMVEPLKMLSTVGTAGIKGLTTVTNVGIQGISSVSNASIKGVSAVGNAGLNVSKQTVNASIKGISTVGNAGLNVSKQTVNASMKGISTVGNAGLNVTKQTAKGISTVSRKGVKGVSEAVLQRPQDAEAIAAAPVELG